MKSEFINSGMERLLKDSYKTVKNEGLVFFLTILYLTCYRMMQVNNKLNIVLVLIY